MFLCFILVFLFVPALFAQDSPPIWQNNHCSIGINAMLLSEPHAVSFRKWNANNKGHQIIIGDETGLAGNKDLQKENGDASDEVFEAQVPSIEYDYLVRTSFLNSGEAYMYTGCGISFSGYYLYTDQSATKNGSIFANLRFPVGIEHFFLKSKPFLSYSVEADFYAGFWKHCYNTSAVDNIAIQLAFGVTPRFFINWYFK